MRLIVALAGILSFANLSFVQAMGLCPLSGAHQQAAEASTAHSGEHAGHAMPVPTDAGSSVNSAPADDTGHPACFMVGPCGVSVDVDRIVDVAGAPIHVEGVRAHSDRTPASLTTAPDIPPPRA